MTRSLPSSYATGNQRPTEYVVPEFAGNDCLDAIELMDRAGTPLMDWQAFLLEAWLGYDERGRWTAKNAGNETPRQNGKTLLVIARAAVEMLLYGGTVLYTSQLQKTSTETFKEACRLFESRALRKFIAPNGIKTALGREEIDLKNGARMKFLARTSNGGDGQHGSLLIFDEAQALDHSAQESFLFAISACATARGPQVIYNGTPPKDTDYGLVFEKIRDDALGGKSRATAWTEWSAGAGGLVPDPNDRELWYRTNPSLGILISEDTIESEAESTEPDKFAHQRLGWWSGKSVGQRLITAQMWKEGEHPEEYERLAAGIRVSTDGAVVAVSFAMRLEGGTGHVEFIQQQPYAAGLRWLEELITRNKDRLATVVIDGKSGAADVERRLVSAGISKQAVKVVNSSECVAAASMLLNMANDGLLTHLRDGALDESALTSVRRKIGSSGGFGFGGERPEIVESCALALYGAMTTKRNPNRKAVVF